MKQIPLREFQQRGSQYLGELPIILTQYKKPVAIVSRYEEVSTVPYPENSKSIARAPTAEELQAYEDSLKDDVPADEIKEKEVVSQEGVVKTDLPPLENIVREIVWKGHSVIDEPIMGQVVKAGIQYCQYKFTQGIKPKCYLISREDGYGKKLFENKWVCDECLKLIQQEVHEWGGAIIGR